MATKAPYTYDPILNQATNLADFQHTLSALSARYTSLAQHWSDSSRQRFDELWHSSLPRNAHIDAAFTSPDEAMTPFRAQESGLRQMIREGYAQVSARDYAGMEETLNRLGEGVRRMGEYLGRLEGEIVRYEGGGVADSRLGLGPRRVRNWTPRRDRSLETRARTRDRTNLHELARAAADQGRLSALDAELLLPGTLAASFDPSNPRPTPPAIPGLGQRALSSPVTVGPRRSPRLQNAQPAPASPISPPVEHNTFPEGNHAGSMSSADTDPNEPSPIGTAARAAIDRDVGSWLTRLRFGSMECEFIPPRWMHDGRGRGGQGS